MKKIIFLFVVNLFVMNGLLAQTREAKPYIEEPKQQQEGDTLDMVQVKAKFPGGEAWQIKFLKDNLKYPDSALKKGIEGSVFIRFVVDKDGSIIKKTIKVIKSVDIELDAEAVRLVNMSPNWTPALQNERPTKQRIRVPVKFKIAK